MDLKISSEVLYVWPNGFNFNERSSDQWIEIYDSQYIGAEKMIEKKAYYLSSRKNPGGDHFRDREFLYEDCYIKLDGGNQIQGSKSTRTIHAFSPEVFNLKKLAKQLGLPLPRDSELITSLER